MAGGPQPAPVRSYAWADIPAHAPRAGVQQRGFRGAHVLVTQNLVQPGVSPNRHSHPFEQLILVTQGTMRLHVGDQLLELGPNSIVRIPPGVEHWAEAPREGEVPFINYDIFAPLREDYLHLVAYQPDFAGAPARDGA